MVGEWISFLCIGSIGTGFAERSLEAGLERGVDFIGADAGSTDGGPFALAGQRAGASRASYERDLSLLLRAARRARVPLLVGSCATSGRDWGVDEFASVVRREAEAAGLQMTLARIYAEQQPATVIEALRAGRVRPLGPGPAYDEEAVRRSSRIVAVMGVEPFQAALRQGADVVLAGRATDTAIFASIPLARGFDPGLAWHAAKIAECGTASAEPRRRLDILHIAMTEDSFVVEPMAEDLRCTPYSVAANQLHEVADPFTMVEPGWVVDMTGTRYEAASDRSVRVSGSVARPAPYTVKLEGVERVGYQKMFMLSVRDPRILADVEGWIANAQADIATRTEEILGPGAFERCELHARIYGRDGTMGRREPMPRVEGHEAMVVVDVVAPDEPVADGVMGVVWLEFMRAKNPGGRGGTVAWPFARSVFDVGEAYRFNVNHVVEVDDPLSPFRIELEAVGR
jgi:hypothetical protein